MRIHTSEYRWKHSLARNSRPGTGSGIESELVLQTYSSITNLKFIEIQQKVNGTRMSLESDRDAVLELTQNLLVAITGGDWDTYAEICDESLTCFEPEALGNLVDGLEFHQYYFNLPSSGAPTPVQSTIVAPHIRIMGDVARSARMSSAHGFLDIRPTAINFWHLSCRLH